MLNWMLVVALWPPIWADEPKCTCATARLTNGWCDACKVGYVANVKIPSAFLFEVLDAHGHEIDVDALPCEQCRKRVRSNGYCEPCRIGWVDRKAYMSRVSYYQAKGTVVEPATLTCSTCKKNAETSGWCPECKRGLVAGFCLRDRADFDQAVIAYQRLTDGVRLLEKCETCAIAFICNSTCPACDLTYRDGKKVDAPTNAERP